MAGKNRAPTMQWARALETGRKATSVASGSARRMSRDIEIPQSSGHEWTVAADRLSFITR
jgi:hypothetical protein